MDKYQTFSANFLVKNGYGAKKIHKYNLAAEDGLAKTWRFFPPT